MDAYAYYATTAGDRSLTIDNNVFEGSGTGYCFHIYTGDMKFTNNIVRDCSVLESGANAGWVAGFGAIENYCIENHAGAWNFTQVTGNTFDNVYSAYRHVPTPGCEGEMAQFDLSHNQIKTISSGISLFESSNIVATTLESITIDSNNVEVTGAFDPDGTGEFQRIGIAVADLSGVGLTTITGNTVLLSAPSATDMTNNDFGILIGNANTTHTEERIVISGNTITVNADQPSTNVGGDPRAPLQVFRQRDVRQNRCQLGAHGRFDVQRSRQIANSQVKWARIHLPRQREFTACFPQLRSGRLLATQLYSST